MAGIQDTGTEATRDMDTAMDKQVDRLLAKWETELYNVNEVVLITVIFSFFLILQWEKVGVHTKYNTYNIK